MKPIAAFSFLGIFLAALLAGAGCAHIHRPATTKEIRITYAGQASSVCLSGDFNAWSTDTDSFIRHKHTWTIWMFLPPGRYVYTLYVNGTSRCPDPGALFTTDDGFGNLNSVLVVP